MGCQGSTATGSAVAKGHTKGAACLGIIRLDYDYPPAPGDIDSPDSFGYDVHYRVIPGFTFTVCQFNTMDEACKGRFKEGVEFLVNEKKVSGITGDCGFMMW